jgi:hypothetical protein
VRRPGVPTVFWFLAFLGVSYFYYRALTAPNPLPDITFGLKVYYESPPAIDNYVYITGTLTGPDIAYPNNTVAVTCYKDRMECLFYSVEQIGPVHIGRLGAPDFYGIKTWNANEVIAVENNFNNCRRTTINIVRKSKDLVWVEEPINQSKADCKDSSTSITKWTIEDSPYWRKAKGKP